MKPFAFIVIFALFLLVFAGFPHAAFDTFTTMDCSFATTTRSINASAIHYENNAPVCGNMQFILTYPNGTTSTFSSTACSAGVHSFSIAAPQNGVYKIQASLAGTNAECSVAALFFERRERVPEFHPLLLLLFGLATVGLLKKHLNKLPD